jgi:hypothetical protein
MIPNYQVQLSRRFIEEAVLASVEALRYRGG